MENPVHRQHGVVAFADTDASGWMHFPNIFKYVEAAEHAFLQSRGVLVFDRALGGWPRVKVDCEYQQPLLTGDRFEVLLEISSIGTSSLTWAFQVLNVEGKIAAHGGMTTVRVGHDGRPVRISETERTLLTGNKSVI
jgi:acyl-CoA thioester hydrolase